MTDKKDVHTCSYYCMHPACVIAQRDFLRDMVEQLKQDIKQLMSEERRNDDYNRIGMV
jgi:hypothetical protein